MKLNLADIAAVLMLVALLASPAMQTIAGMPSSSLLAQLAQIHVPSLTKIVEFDGRISQSDEWSDASQTSLSLSAITPTAQQPQIETVVWAKHDGKWLYLLHRTRWSSLDPRDNGGISYYWGRFTSNLYERSDRAAVALAFGGSDYYGWDGQSWYLDTADGGTNDVQGRATHDGTYYWFEFRKLLNSGDAHDWLLTSGDTYGTSARWGGRDYMSVMFFDASETRAYLQAVSLSLSAQTTTAGPTTTLHPTATTAAGTTVVTGEKTAGQAAGQIPVGRLGLAVMVAAIGVISSLALLVRRRRRLPPSTATQELASKTQTVSVKEVLKPPEPSISTGYADLDRLLAGGLPEGYAVVFVSPSCDEIDLLIRKVIESALASGRAVFYVSNDTRRTKDLADKLPTHFYGFCPQASKVASSLGNLSDLPSLDNLSDLNISLNKALEHLRTKEIANKVMVIDILSDVLFRHKSLTTRKWFSDFASRRKAEGFTLLATLNPLIGPKEEIHPVLSLFDGVIEIFEKEMVERSRRFLVVRKMYGRRYSESELMLDKEKLF